MLLARDIWRLWPPRPAVLYWPDPPSSKHTDETGKSTPARSKVARRMRVALRGQKNVEHKGEAKKAIFKEGAPIYAKGTKGPNMGSMMKKGRSTGRDTGPYRSREQAIDKAGKAAPRKTEVTTSRGKYGMDTRWHRNPHYKY